jgi:uncharacterized protein (TIGR02217 family)
MPEFKTLMQTSVSGLDATISLWNNPRWTWSLPYDVLRSDIAHSEYQMLLALFMSVGACGDTFLYSDWEDNAVTGQAIATGDGSTKSFQMQRTWAYTGFGTITEPVLATNVVSAVYLNGVSQSSGWSVSNGVLTFTAAPTNTVAITADFTYYWRCRFTEDTATIDALYYKFWALKKIEIRSVKLGSA